jgi:hypothetical protein
MSLATESSATASPLPPRPRSALQAECIAKSIYAVGDAVTTTFIIANVGGATAVNARIGGGNEDGLDRKTDPPSAHQDLQPGQSFSIDWTGTVNKTAAVAGYASGSWSATNDAGEANPVDNTGRFKIAVPGATGVLHVKVFVDVKGDYDVAQPGLASATVVIQDEAKTTTIGTVKTGADGYFTKTLPAGEYWLTAPAGSSRAGSRDTLPSYVRIHEQLRQIASPRPPHRGVEQVMRDAD